jgi:two-component SAPR family response regulator
VRPYLTKKKKKKPSQKRNGGVAQGIGPEFKSQHQKKNEIKCFKTTSVHRYEGQGVSWREQYV